MGGEVFDVAVKDAMVAPSSGHEEERGTGAVADVIGDAGAIGAVDEALTIDGRGGGCHQRDEEEPNPHFPEYTWLAQGPSKEK